ncbi:MAG: right-handed parallel beta-helix repeat-containing protein [Limisphaerales bacterium]
MQFAGSAFAIARQRGRAVARFLFTITALLAACVHASAATAPKVKPAQTSPALQAIAQFKSADLLLQAGQLAAAKAELVKVINLPDAMDHHVAEARQRIQEIERREAGLPARDTNANRLRLPPTPSPGLTLHVSPSGADSNPGTAERPLASLEGARDRIRSLRKSGSVPAGSAVILVHGGDYQVTHTLTLTAEDSGTEQAPVIYRAAPGEKPRFIGGVPLHGFQPVADPAILKRLPANMAKKVLALDLKTAGITNLLPLELGGFASGHGFKTHPAHELFFNGRAMALARGPNEGFLRVADVAVKDGTKGYDREGSKVGKFFYEGDRPARWAGEPDLLLYGYWFWDWADSYERVQSIDTQKRLITLAQPWHTYGYSIGAHFYAVNALWELDSPGEYYLDRQSLRLFFYPPSDPGKASMELSLLAEPMVNLEGASHVRFERLTWELGCHDALHVTGGSNCLFAGCVVRKFAGTGITITGGQKHGLLSCDIYSMGRGGVALHGGDRKTLAPAEHFVENCDIHDLSRIDHTYTPAIALGGVGIRIAHNRLHDVLSSALNVGGNDIIIEYNEVFNAVLESDDQGGVDMFGDPTFRGNVYRFNYWHDIGGQGNGMTAKCGRAGIRLDDAIPGTLIYGNVLQRCSTGKDGFGGVQINGGKDNVIDNNLFIECAAAISIGSWEPEHWREWTAPYLTNNQIDAALYLRRYPALATLKENVTSNAVYRNLLIGCGELLRHPSKAMETEENTVLAHGDTALKPGNPLLNRPGFARIPVGDFGLYPDEFRLEGPVARD